MSVKTKFKGTQGPWASKDVHICSQNQVGLQLGLMNWLEAVKAMENGLRVRNSRFGKREYFEMHNNHIVDEDGFSRDNWYDGEHWKSVGWCICGCKVSPVAVLPYGYTLDDQVVLMRDVKKMLLDLGIELQETPE